MIKLLLCAVFFSPIQAIEIYFKPHDHCEKRILDIINQVKKTVLVQAFVLTDPDIIQALCNAKKRSCVVQIIVDKREKSNYLMIKAMKQADIPVWIDNTPKIAHSKNIIVDNRIVITGSYNFTTAAKRYNAETLLIIDEKDIVQKFVQNWEERKAKSMMFLPQVMPYLNRASY